MFDGLTAPLSEVQRRCVDYMQRVADTEGFELSLKPTHANQELMCALWDLTNSSESSVEKLKAMSYELAQLSKVPMMQGLKFPEPSHEELEELERLFNRPIGVLNTCDSKYIPMEAHQIYIEFELESDDTEALKLTPNVQLSLFDLLEPEVR